MEERVKRWPECQFFFCSNPGKPARIDGVVGARAPPPESTSASPIVSGFSPVDVIPPEVWALVFEFLTLRDLQRSAALVCRAWRAVATDQCTVARLFWRHYHCDRQRRDRQRPTSRYTDAQLRNRASGASALPSPPEIIHLHFGQAGRFVPRAVLVDRQSMGSVLDTANAKRMRSMICPDNDLMMEGEAVDEQKSRLVEVVRKEMERADFVDGFLMFLQLGEMGQLERQLLLACVEEWPDIVSVAAAVMPPIDSVSDLVCWDVARTLHHMNDCTSMAVLLDGTPRPYDPTTTIAGTYDVLADAFSGATHPLRFGRTAAMRMTTELVPYPFFHLLSLSHVPIVATCSDEPTPPSPSPTCLSGDAPLGHNDSVCHAAFATFHTNPAAGRQKYGEVEAAVRAGARQDKRSSGVELASVLVSRPLARLHGQQRVVDLDDTETLSYLDDMVAQWRDYQSL
ncbi:uncharacterized protein ACA1_114420 [Acanthamoeba castellanii str. Neff]|uniref:F-box domain-containing protein n=1 Tax=Acanthamoeba castellanii (strain ATCC 30010 / Neff) TaxID=1257118 RepID=L8H5S0_ACACF|nr:uncharacterized protein ACA1_114420 [Acanthamoeba castellanii str. Neff]ELR20063.1 hypothetical protein ACA1_114420 [Acanthamoeba castellanii str. Neff]